MAHLIETLANGKSSMAYVGQTPWHNLGQRLSEDAPIAVWQEEAGLNWSAISTPVRYLPYDGTERKVDGSNILYRSDTCKALGIVSNRYQIVQPDEVLEFFDKLTKAAGFKMETAGCLAGGKRIWALAKVGEGECVGKEDIVEPYVLLATSFDGSMATIAKFTSVRVVCQNTLSYANDTSSSRFIRIPHSRKFDANKVRNTLGIATDLFRAFMADMRSYENIEVRPDHADELTRELLEIKKDAKRTHSGYTKIMNLFRGAATGSDLTQGYTGWQFINSVTEWVDHYRGHTQDSRLNSAWFGEGDLIKSKAKELIHQL